MAEGNFDRCLAVTARWEGGEVNHKDDPGGHTNLGVAQATYDTWRRRWGQPTRSVSRITNAEAARIYREGYWDAVNAERLFAGVDLATFDAGVNSGPARGRKWLNASLDPQNRHQETVKGICRRRLSFVQGLGTWKVFGKGWGNRIADIQAKGVAWALVAMNDPIAAEQQLEDEAAGADKSATQQQGGAATSGAGWAGAGGAGATGVDQAADFPSWLTWGLAAVLIALAVVLFLKARQKRQQAEAYRREARALAP